MFLFALPSLLQIVKVIFTIGFILTFTSVFSAAMIHIWVWYYSCFFAELRFGLSDLSRFVAFLSPLGYAIHGAPY